MTPEEKDIINAATKHVAYLLTVYTKSQALAPTLSNLIEVLENYEKKQLADDYNELVAAGKEITDGFEKPMSEKMRKLKRLVDPSYARNWGDEL